MKKILVAAALVAAIFAAGTDAHALVTLEGRYWFTTLDATVKTSESSVIGTDINLVDDLGFKSKKNFPELRFTLGGERHKLRYGYLPLEWDGSKTITKSIVFAGKTYSASTNVTSKLTVDYHRIGYQYDFITSKDKKESRLGFIFDIKYFNIDASLDAPTLALSKTNNIKAPVPTIGFGGGFNLPAHLSVNAEATGLSISAGGGKFSVFDAEGSLRFRPVDWFAACAGYRLLKLHASVDNDKADIGLKGPYLQMMLLY
ncbi:MAG: hypothetical protein HY884_08920 [Deltaproteobacteria bacterium]|nr:hypothetical protein [Deltaproteobacteria bacterium]